MQQKPSPTLPLWGRDDLAHVASPKSVTGRGISVFTVEFKRGKPKSAPLQSTVDCSNHLNLSAATYPSWFFYYGSHPLLSFPASPALPQIFPNSRFGSAPGQWVMAPARFFYTVPSTERRIKLIRVNKCGGALPSGAPIGSAPPSSAHTDGAWTQRGRMRVEERWRRW